MIFLVAAFSSTNLCEGKNIFEFVSVSNIMKNMNGCSLNFKIVRTLHKEQLVTLWARLFDHR